MKCPVTQATNSDRALVAAISPDAKYVLTVMNDQGLNSLWLRNVATGSDTQVVAPTASIRNVAFSPDGNYIYYRRAMNGLASDFNIFRAGFGRLAEGRGSGCRHTICANRRNLLML